MGFRHPRRVHRLRPLRRCHHPADHRMGNYSLIRKCGEFLSFLSKKVVKEKHRDQDRREI